ncbi:MAG TPA: DoxX family membrane protein [Streptosporangiaceae bacterium]
MRTRPLYDIVALLARIGIGAVFIAHGWQKVQVGITTTSDQFTAWDVPFPTAAAVYATFVELLGGAALIVGLALPIAGLLLFVDMAGSVIFVNGTHGIFLVDEHGAARNGFELALVLGLSGLFFAAGGAGRLTLDNRLFSRRAAPAGAGAPEPAGGVTPAARSGPAAPSAVEPRIPPADAGSDPPAAARSTLSDKPLTATASGTSGASGKPGKAAKPGKPAMPATTGGPTVAESAAAAPRLAADIVKGTAGDTLVAGRKERRSGRKDRRGTERRQDGEHD